MSQEIKNKLLIEAIKSNIALLTDATGTKLKETLQNDLSLLEARIVAHSTDIPTIVLQVITALEKHTIELDVNDAIEIVNVKEPLSDVNPPLHISRISPNDFVIYINPKKIQKNNSNSLNKEGVH